MATIHPAYVLRNPGQQSVFTEDIRRFARAIRGEFQAVNVRTYYVASIAGLKRLRALLEAGDGPIAYDVESYYYPWSEEWGIVCLGVALTDSQAFVVPLYHPQSPFRKRWREVLTYLKPALEDRVARSKSIAQNGKFDNMQLSGAGVFLRHRFDIMLAAHVLDENRPKNLGFLSQSILGTDEYKGMVETKPERILKEPIRDICRYNGYDCGYTRQIYPRLRSELIEHPRLTRLFTKLLMPASDVIQEVEVAGMYVSRKRLHRRMIRLQGYIDAELKVLRSHLPRNRDWPSAWRPRSRSEFNFNSPQQLGHWLFSAPERGGLGLSPLERTANGNNSTREAVLLHYKEHPAITALMRYRTLQLKWMNTYLLPWSLRLDARSRLHTSYRIFGTVTGRLSGDMQQVPRDSFIRSVIGAPPGWRFIQADYSQIELRIAAHVAKEARMQRSFLLGEDLHLTTARSMMGTPTITKEQRKLAKSVNFGFIYGMYPKKFQSYAFENYDLKVSLSEAELFRRQFFETYPDLLTWHDRQRRLVHANHQVQSPIGRIRHLPDILSGDRQVRAEAERQAINSPVQSMASDMMLFAMVQLRRQLNPHECFMVGTLHDGIFFQARENVADQYSVVIKQVMEDLPLARTFGCHMDIPIVADVEHDQWWQGTPNASGLGVT